jgi:hypothetical protein
VTDPVEEDIAIQLGITVDDEGSPLIVMVFPDIFDPDTGDELTILLGDAEDAAVFATQLLRAGQTAVELGEELEGVNDTKSVTEIVSNYAKKLQAPYN